MRVFVSWSGSRSRKYAEHLCDFLGHVIQPLELWMSPEIPKGAAGVERIFTELRECQAGVVVLTKDRVDSKWLNFEAGALMTHCDHERLFPIWVDVSDNHLQGSPLVGVQGTQPTREDMARLTADMNQMLDEPIRIRPDKVTRTFNDSWEAFEIKLAEIEREDVMPLKLPTKVDVASPQVSIPECSIGQDVLSAVLRVERLVASGESPKKEVIDWSDQPERRRQLGQPLSAALRAVSEHGELVADIEHLHRTGHFKFETIRAAAIRYGKYPASVVSALQDVIGGRIGV